MRRLTRLGLAVALATGLVVLLAIVLAAAMPANAFDAGVALETAIGPAEPAVASRAPMTFTTDTAGWFSFTLPWDEAAPGRIDAGDLRFLPNDPLEVISDEHDLSPLIEARGFVTTTSDGHFAFTNTGDRVRFWGTNLTFSATMPLTREAELLAARLAGLGFNAVRIHHIDSANRDGSLWCWPGYSTQHIDQERLRRLDYLIYQLKRQGIYAVLNLHVSRTFRPSDGVIYARELLSSSIPYGRGVTLFDPVMIGLQKQYAEQLLTHVNPWSGKSYAQDPAIALIEITNENSLFLSFARNWLHHRTGDATSLPQFYSDELDGWISSSQPTINRLYNPGFENEHLAEPQFDPTTPEGRLTLDSCDDQPVWRPLGWFTETLGSAQAAFQVYDAGIEAGQVMSITVIKASGNPPEIKLGQRNLSVQAGRTYTLSWQARASEPTQVRAVLALDRDLDTTIGLSREFAIGTEWTTITRTFKATTTTYGSAVLALYLGHAQGTIQFDDFHFSENPYLDDPKPAGVRAVAGWHGWLEREYGTTEALSNTWALPAGQWLSPTEMLENGDFETWPLTGWISETFQGGAAMLISDTTTATHGSRSLLIDVTEGGARPTQVQVQQDGLALAPGQTYQLSFMARADASGSLVVFLQPQARADRNLKRDVRQEFQVGPAWQEYGLIFAPDVAPDGRLRFAVGGQDWSVWLDDVRLTPYNRIGLTPGERLEENSVRRISREEMLRYTPQRVNDTLRFYEELQTAYFREMHQFLEDDLGVQALKTGTASVVHSANDLKVMSRTMDFVDHHVYWDHPRWPGADWEQTGEQIANKAWVDEPFAKLLGLAAMTVEGKPVSISEFGQLHPNRYALETPLLLATLGNLQDWDALFHFGYANDRRVFSATHVTDYAPMAGNPIQSGLTPLLARLFLAGQSAPLTQTLPLSLTAGECSDSARYSSGGDLGVYLRRAKGVSETALFAGRLQVSDLDLHSPVTLTVPPQPGSPPFSAANGQLAWDADPGAAGSGLYTIDGADFQGALGFLTGRVVALSNMTLDVPTNTAGFAAVLLQSRDGQPLNEAGDMLLGIFTRVENTGQAWDDSSQTSLHNWGGPPALIEPINMTLTLSVTNAQDVEVWALNERGLRSYRLPVPSFWLSSDKLVVKIDTGQDRTLWYTLLRPPAVCDVNGDGRRDVRDVQLVNRQFGRWAAEAGEVYDLHWDGVIDLRDVQAAGECWLMANGVDLKNWSLKRAWDW